MLNDPAAATLRHDYHEGSGAGLDGSGRGAAPRTARRARRCAGATAFAFTRACGVTSQDMLYQTVRPAIERERPRLLRAAQRLAASAPGSLRLKPGFPVPRSVSAVDIHLMPGSYVAEYGDDDLTMGAVYEQRLAISTFGLFGPNLDDIGQSIARFVRERHPRFVPKQILDLGCTVGHNTGAWKDAHLGAEVHGIDVAALLPALWSRSAPQRRDHFTRWSCQRSSFRRPVSMSCSRRCSA
ncbi:MAG: hypothetical protein R3E65_06525 [Steroidobacteraceae bacterium]